MAVERPLPPVWLMGFGSVTAIALFPGFSSFLLAPLLDWRFSRRAYAIGLTILSGLSMFGALVFIRDLRLLAAMLFVSNTAISLCVAAVGGWFGNLTPTEDKPALGAWFTVSNLGAGGVVASLAIYLLRDLPYALGAGVLCLSIVMILPLYFLTPCPPADGRLASESFREFARDVLALLRRPAVLWALLIFLMPSASFALTNTLSGFGRDFSISEKMAGLIGGVGIAIAGVVGSLVVPELAKRVAARPLYLLVGGFGAAFTLALVMLNKTPTTFGLAMLGENGFQAAAFSVAYVITLRTIGHDNPLAATQFGLLTSATSLPLSYMQVIDGQAYGSGGVNGSYLADALVSGGACVVLGLILWVWRRSVVEA